MIQSEQLQDALKQMWQKLPHEERVLLSAQAKARGIEACTICIVLASAVTVSLRMPGILMGSLCFMPLLYQVISRRTWLATKPLTVIRYFLAGVSARLFAEKLHSADPSLKLIFRGTLEPLHVDGSREENQEFAEELAEEKPNPKDVWVSLFPDSLVMISEGDSGATLEFAHSTLHDFTVTVDTPEDSRGNSLASRLVIQTNRGDEEASRWVLSSPHTTTLLACERKIRFFNQRSAERSLVAPPF